jgi:hypothetical protein
MADWSYFSYVHFISLLFSLIQPQELKVHFVYSLQVLLSRLNFFGSKQISNAENEGLKSYRDTAEAVICGLIPDSPQATASRTGGIL